METAIITRIRQIMAHFNLNAATFADKINIQRSALSHIFSERNKPSLDVVQKIIQIFPEINTNWLLTGKESMVSLYKEDKFIDLQSNINTDLGQVRPDITNVNTVGDEFEEEIIHEKEDDFEKQAVLAKKKIEMITVFYADKTFSVYHPEDFPPILPNE